MNYPEEVLQALKESITYWEDICNLKDVIRGSNGCVLCSYFRCDGGHISCDDGCPVFLKTNKATCKNTPYEKAHFLFTGFSLDYSLWHQDILDVPKEKLEEYLVACREELEFLRSLLPNEEVNTSVVITNE